MAHCTEQNMPRRATSDSHGECEAVHTSTGLVGRGITGGKGYRDQARPASARQSKPATQARTTMGRISGGVMQRKAYGEGEAVGLADVRAKQQQ